MTQTQVITITDKAVEKVKGFIKAENRPVAGLRVYVAGGGCSGLTYGMALEESQTDDDIVVEKDSLRILIDPFSIKHLKGSEIDYVENLMGSGFKINNPNVVSSCACGHSFNT